MGEERVEEHVTASTFGSTAIGRERLMLINMVCMDGGVWMKKRMSAIQVFSLFGEEFCEWDKEG